MSNASSPQAFFRRIAQLSRAAVLAVVAGVVVAAALVLGTDRPEPLPMAESALQAEVLVVSSADPRTSNDAVYRPLFWQERRPLQAPQQPVVREVVQESRLEGVQLLGVVVADGASVAILDVRGTRKRLALGEQLEGWQLLTVDAEQATFSSAGNNDGQQLTLALERNTHE